MTKTDKTAEIEKLEWAIGRKKKICVSEIQEAEDNKIILKAAKSHLSALKAAPSEAVEENSEITSILSCVQYDQRDVVEKDLRRIMKITGETSDGHHTFNELYEHRHILFLAVLTAHIEKSWRSKLHADGTMFDGWFVAGLNTDDGQATYHLPMRIWELFKYIPELDRSPEWDGHSSNDVLVRIRDMAFFGGVKTTTAQPPEGVDLGALKHNLMQEAGKKFFGGHPVAMVEWTMNRVMETINTPIDLQAVKVDCAKKIDKIYGLHFDGTNPIVNAVIDHLSTRGLLRGADGWMEWNGGECPFKSDTRLIVKFRNGQVSKEQRADHWRWWPQADGHEDKGFDIVAFKLAAPNADAGKEGK